MILGRNTSQWTGLITAISGALTSSLPIITPNGIGGIAVSGLVTLIGIFTAFLGVFIMFLANETTPISDPRLPIGTRVNVTDANATTGVVVPETSGMTSSPAGIQVVEAPAVVVNDDGQQG